MPLTRELLFFFSALGAFNGFLFGLYFLLLARPRLLWKQLFGAFVLALSARVGKSVFLFFNPGLAREFLQVGLTACLFIGPLLYFYVRTATEGDSRNFRRSMAMQLIGWGLVALVGGTLFPYAEYVGLWRGYVIYGIYTVWAVYTALTIFRARTQVQSVLKGNGSSRDRLITYTSLGTAVVLGCYAMVSYTSYISGALAFTLLLYATWAAVRLRGETGTPAAAKHPSPAPDTKPAAPTAREQQLITALNRVMVSDRPYVNPNLKLADLAASIGATTHELSSLLNGPLNNSFHQYVNEHRIGLAKQLITTEEHLTLEAIGQACGFNARSTFYSAFKKQVGTTPAKFREEGATNT